MCLITVMFVILLSRHYLFIQGICIAVGGNGAMAAGGGQTPLVDCQVSQLSSLLRTADDWCVRWSTPSAFGCDGTAVAALVIQPHCTYVSSALCDSLKRLFGTSDFSRKLRNHQWFSNPIYLSYRIKGVKLATYHKYANNNLIDNRLTFEPIYSSNETGRPPEEPGQFDRIQLLSTKIISLQCNSDSNLTRRHSKQNIVSK